MIVDADCDFHARDPSDRSWTETTFLPFFILHGAAVAGHPWHSFNPCHVSYQSVMRCGCGELTGYGEVGDIFGLDYLAERMSRAGRRRPADA